MSFPAAIKHELAEMIPEDSELFLAELQGLPLYGTKLTEMGDDVMLCVLGENEESMKKYFTFIKKTNRTRTDSVITIQHLNGKTKSYSTVLAREDAAVLLESTGLGYEGGEFEIGRKSEQKLFGKEERRVFLRGVFLAAGSVSDSARFYHLEFVYLDETKAWRLKLLLSTFDAMASVVQRKGHYVAYVKDSNDIVNLLGRIGASHTLLVLERIRVLRGTRNRVNRMANCETANLQETAAAILKQRKDTEYTRDTEGFDDLPPTFAGMTEVRLEHPDMSLKELGTRLNPPVGKSGVSHRLQKLSEYADELRDKRKEGRTVIGRSMVVKLNGKKADAILAVMLIQVASQYESSTYMDDVGKRINAKSIMDMTILGLADGLETVVTADGKDEDTTITGIEEYLCQ